MTTSTMKTTAIANSSTVKSHSSLFLMEQLIVITLFAFCAAVCIYILSAAYMMTNNAVDTRNALMVAENAAEVHKMYRGDAAQVAQILHGTTSEQSVTVFFDAQWHPTTYTQAYFELKYIQSAAENNVILAEITVDNLLTGTRLVTLTSAIRGVGYE